MRFTDGTCLLFYLWSHAVKQTGNETGNKLRTNWKQGRMSGKLVKENIAGVTRNISFTKMILLHFSCIVQKRFTKQLRGQGPLREGKD